MKKSEEEKERGEEDKEEDVMSVSSSTVDESEDFLGFTSVKKVSCYLCGDHSMSAEDLALDNLQQLLKVGLRWICPLCLKGPSEVKSLKQELNEFKMSMKEELINMRDCFNAKLKCFNTAEPVKRAPKSTHASLPTSNISHQVIVTTGDKTKFTQQTFAEKVKSSLSTVPVQSLKVNKEGCGIITFPDNSTRDDGLSILSKEFKTEANDRPQRMLLPSLTLVDIKSSDYKSTDAEKLLKAISSKNPEINSLIVKGKVFKVLFIKEDPKRSNSSFAVLRVDPEIYHVIRSLGFRLYIDFSRCRVNERFFCKQCYNCQKFRHQTNECQLKSQEKQICRYCSEDHDGRTCPHKSDINKYKCGNCQGNHSSTYRQCPVLLNEVNNLIQRTQGMENFSKNDIRPHAIIT